MSNPSSGSGQAPGSDDRRTLQEQKELWDSLTRKRQDMLDEERRKLAEKIAAEEQLSKRQQQEFLAETDERKVRAEDREEWRQEQHRKRLEADEQQRKEAVVKQHEAEVRAKKEEQQKKRQATLDDLHRKAVERRVREKVEGAQLQEEKQKQSATHLEERATGDIDADERRAIEHIDREERRKKDMLRAEAQRKQESAEETYQKAKHDAALALAAELRTADSEEKKRVARFHETQILGAAEASRKRVLLGLEEAMMQGIFNLETESKRLREEIQKAAAARRGRVQRDAQRKRMDAQARRESTEKWFEKGRLDNHEHDGL